jgi:hypothetical protein
MRNSALLQQQGWVKGESGRWTQISGGDMQYQFPDWVDAHGVFRQGRTGTATIPTVENIAAKGVTNLSTSSLNPTHYITKSKTAMQTLMNDIRANGIQESIKYVEHNGVKYIVDGHHRFYAAQRLGIQNVPVQQVQLPYGGYKGVMDLMMEPGKQPGFWKFIK